jgi:hypothetical protein
LSDLAKSGGIDMTDIDGQLLFSMTRKERPPLVTFGKLDSVVKGDLYSRTILYKVSTNAYFAAVENQNNF